MVGNNDQILLDHIVEEERLRRYPDTKTPTFFEQYVAEQILKDYDLSDEEVEHGLIGGGADGGIDGFYIFVNGEPVFEDFDHSSLKKQIYVDVYLIQSKTSAGFGEDAINKAIATTQHLFDISTPLEKFKAIYNQQLLSLATTFRELWHGMATKFPQYKFHYVYATRGNEVHPNVRRKTDDLKEAVRGLFPKEEFEFDFVGAGELLELARRQPVTRFQLPYVEQLTGKDGYIVLVKLYDFYCFIRNENGLLRKSLFEANVRDYQGKSSVNDEVHQTLVSGGPEEFWWLNNGITIVTTQANQGNKVLTLEDPQVVNGQQTSTEIFNFCAAYDATRDERSVMVRVISANDVASRDKIIKATNSQTPISIASLRATEKIHRDIEQYLQKSELYYDRRKNSQRQQGRPSSKIVSISLLAQALMSILLQRPNDARARPSTIIKKDTDYSEIFSEKHPINIYLVAAQIIKRVQTDLRRLAEIDAKDRTNIQFYVAMALSSLLTKSAKPSAIQLAAIKMDEIPDELIQTCIRKVFDTYLALGGNDHIARSSSLVDTLKTELEGQFPNTRSLQGKLNFS